MSNTLTNLIPDAYAAMDVVSRELSGSITSVARDAKTDAVALGQSIRIPVTPKNVGGIDIVPAMALPAEADQTIGNATLTLTKSRAYPFSYSGEEQYALDKGVGYLTIKQDQIAQAMRGLVNEIATDINAAAVLKASRAYGTAGTTPFATNLAATAQLKKILDDNGAPQADRQLVISTNVGAAVRTLSQLTKVNEGGDSTLLRQGELLNIHNFSLKEDAQVVSGAAVGTSTTATTDTAGYEVGTTLINLAAVGTGTILAGDVITFAGDSNQYVVSVGTGAVSGSSIVLNSPGLVKALPASAKAITIVGASEKNLGFSRNAIVLATRLPEYPTEGDLAIFRETLTDARSGLSFEISAYGGFKMVTYHISAVWGVKVIKPEHLALLLG